MPEVLPLNDADRDELHARRNADQIRVLVTPIIEQSMCRALNITWSDVGAHWIELAQRAEDNRRIREEWSRRTEVINTVRKSLWEKVLDRSLNFILGAGGLATAMWLAKKFGITLQ